MAQRTRALVILDIQNEFMSANGNFPISDACKQDLIKNLKALVPQFRKVGHIIWVKAIYENRTDEPASMKETPKGSNEWLTIATHVHPTPCCEAGSFGAELYPEVFALADPEDAVIIKGWYSAFKESTLLEVLRAKNVTSAYFCGLASGTCVLATILDAIKFKDLQVYAVPDCMAWRRYNTHEEAIQRMKELPVNLVDSDLVMSSTQPLPLFTIIFVLGGPGAGKGTQCSKLVEDYHVHHLSIGDLLREELIHNESGYASTIRENIAEGRVGAPEMTLGILKTAMSRLANDQGVKAFIIDGFPRKLDRADLFEETICAPAAVLLLDCSEQIQQERLLLRASTSGRTDDTIEVMQKRFKDFSENTISVVEHYEKQGKLRVVNAEEEPDVVYGHVKVALGEILVPRCEG